MFTLTFNKEEDLIKINEVNYILGCKFEILHPIKHLNRPIKPFLLYY